MYYIE